MLCHKRKMLRNMSCTGVVNVIVILSCFWAVTTSLYSNEFAVHIPAGEDRANEIAQKNGFSNLGQIGSLRNFYLFEHSHVKKRSVDASQHHHKILEDHPDIHWFEQQVEKKRVKRDFTYFEGNSGPGASNPFYPQTHSFLPSYQNGFVDPLWKEQWYLTSGSKDGYDMNVQAAWKRGYTGKGIVVSILDDGIQTNHPDLKQNYDPQASTDINENDSDPTPQDNGDNKHGTRCAGEVAATAGNNICGVGVAYNASIGGVRMLDGTVNDAVEAKALGLNPDHVDIYSASWGPEDDGKTVDGPGPLARRAFIYGVTNGRRGLGSIFIWASGNGGRHVDSCNCDGYTNSIFTLSISSATQGGYKPWYLEECASTLATTYSSGTPTLDKSVATVDMDGRLRPDHICTVEHTGTSASAPLAAGIAALALEANPRLSWRDLQHLVVMTSRPDPLEKEEGWFVNGVKRKFSHKFGYGLMDAGKMVELAENWVTVPPQHICKSREIREDREIPGSHLGKSKVFMDVDGCAGTNSEIRFLEHVQCKISLRFFPRGNLRILLTSPMGTTSVLLFERPRDVSSSNFDDWPFLSVHFWGEQAHGRWTLEIINSGSRRINQPGLLKKWQLILYGTDIDPVRYRSRSLHHPQQSFESAVAQAQPQYRQAPPPGGPLLPRFVPQEYLFPGASESVPQVQKPQVVRSNKCQHEYWIPDLSICVNDCPDGYFGDADHKKCLSCPQRCKSCHNSTSCTACEHNLVLYDSSCVSVCPEGFYEADSSCETCPTESCGACAGPMGNECIKCQKGFTLYQNACIRQCPEGYRSTEAGECIQCPVGCKSCDDQKCFRCFDFFNLSSSSTSCVQSQSSCPSGLFLDTEQNQCVGCGSENCVGCIGVGRCTQCKPGYFVFRGTCINRCYEGLYTSFNLKECFSCPKLCTKCKTSEICTECRSDGMLQDGKCLPHCTEGYFNDVGNCARCTSGCKTCIGASDNDCVTCNPGYTFTKGGNCLPSNALNSESSNRNQETVCPDGSWKTPGGSCLPCHPTCSRCTGDMPYHCRSCVAPLRLDRGSSRCIECCTSSDKSDCCHCDAKRHTQNVHTPLTANYNGECHFVSRRVSESEERELSSGKWNDSMVLSFFWLSVFVVVAALVVIFHKQRNNNRLAFSSKNEFTPLGSNGTNLYPKSKYTPVSLREDLQSHEDMMDDKFSLDNDDDDHQDIEYDFDEENSEISEDVPLVLKT